MQQLSEQAQELINDFKSRLNTVPAEEREMVVKKMTESINAINDDVKALFASLQESMNKKVPEDTDNNNDIEHISDYM